MVLNFLKEGDLHEKEGKTAGSCKKHFLMFANLILQPSTTGKSQIESYIVIGSDMVGLG